MAQHDYIIANASGAAVRADLNSSLAAIVSQNSGATAPTPTYAYMPWADTTTGLLKFRNAANSDWVTVGTLASANLGLLTGPGSAGTADQVLGTNGSGVQSWVDRQRLVRATAVASTSGTSVDFTGIPSWARKITVMLNGVSASGTSNLLLQIGDSGGIENTGYTSAGYGGAPGGSNIAASTSTAGLILTYFVPASSAAFNGVITLCSVSGNTWVSSGVTNSTSYAAFSSGTKTLSDVLTQVRITTVNGTDTFDAGSINIIYEG